MDQLFDNPGVIKVNIEFVSKTTGNNRGVDFNNVLSEKRTTYSENILWIPVRETHTFSMEGRLGFRE